MLLLSELVSYHRHARHLAYEALALNSLAASSNAAGNLFEDFDNCARKNT